LRRSIPDLTPQHRYGYSSFDYCLCDGPSDISERRSPINIEVDDSATFDYDDGESQASSAQSLSSSIWDYVFSYGRKYHWKSEENQQYLLSSDGTELDRFDMIHHLTLVTLDGDLYKAPLEGNDPHNVLDCGTETGIWGLDFGSMHPGSHVIGVDLAPNQPSWTYPNVEFQTDDLEKDWTFKKNHFNYIHFRMVG
ncbi:hypothetical protein EX30DRAFT_169457, partial [Ascodesmis nigricans]